MSSRFSVVIREDPGVPLVCMEEDFFRERMASLLGPLESIGLGIQGCAL